MSTWKRSSKCGSGSCVEACRQGSIVLVRDSKNPGVYQAWTPDEWRGLLGCVKVGWRPEGVRDLVDGCVELGLERHDDKHTFDAGEWDAFTKAVIAGEFEIDELPEFKELSSPAAETGVSPAPGRPGGSDGVAGSDQIAAAGAGITGRDTPVPVAAPLNVPAGSAPTPRVGQPGLTNLERVHKVVLTQIRLGGSKTEIAEAIVADLQEGGLIVDDPAVEKTVS